MKNATIAAVMILGGLCMMANAADKQSIPFPQALERSSVALTAFGEAINDALILGNGDLNGLLFAEGDDLVFRITKNDVWDARLDADLNPPLPTLARLKELGQGDWSDRNWILPEGMDYHKKDAYHAHPYPCPRACAVLRLKGAAKGLKTAKLDIRKARADVVAGDAATGLFVPADTNVIVVSTDVSASLERILSESIPQAETGEADGCSWITQAIPGDVDWPGMSFAVAMCSEAGTTAVSVVTSLESDDPRQAAIAMVNASLKSERLSALKKAHEEAWAAYWSRSGINAADEVLERVWYRALYFMRCVTKPGVLSPGLFAGLLDDAPMWHGDFHTNYNIQQTFWSAYAANQCELTEPYDRLITEYLPRARWLAREMFACEGAFYPHVIFAYEPPDPETCKSPHGRQYVHHVWAFTLGVAGFTVQPLWWHYKYDPDPEFLKEVAYPAVRDVAVFYADFVEQCERKGDRIVLAPTVSPEHHGWTHKFRRNRDGTFCIAYFHCIFDAAIEGAGILGQDESLVARWKAAKALLPDYPLNPGEPKVVVDVEGAEPITYNIPVPTTPVFPADQIGFSSDSATQGLFARTLAGLEHNGNNAPVMLAVARARLGTADALSWLRTELMHRERRNGTLSFNRIDSGHKFNDFGHYTEMFGAALAVSELLLQSVGDVIRVFPAWPKKLSARFAQLRTQGGFLVSAEYADGKVGALRVESTAGGPLRLELPWDACEVRNAAGAWKPVTAAADGTATIQTAPGDMLEFRHAQK